MMNLFVGVVTSTYNREKDNLGKNYLLTENQKKWIEAKIILINAKPRRRYKQPSTSIRKFLFAVAQNKRFEMFINICIILNTICLMIKSPHME
jgi:hypothetical protein